MRSNIDHIFEITDKTGRKIRLTKTQFKHVICHKGMENYIEEIQDTLKSPLKIVPHEKGDLYDYYNYYKNRKQKAKYLQVVVKYLNGDGFVLTAYFTRHMQYHDKKYGNTLRRGSRLFRDFCRRTS